MNNFNSCILKIRSELNVTDFDSVVEIFLSIKHEDQAFQYLWSLLDLDSQYGLWAMFSDEIQEISMFIKEAHEESTPVTCEERFQQMGDLPSFVCERGRIKPNNSDVVIRFISRHLNKEDAIERLLFLFEEASLGGSFILERSTQRSLIDLDGRFEYATRGAVESTYSWQRGK